MTDNEIKQYIDYAINKSISEFKKCGILKESESASYSDATEIIANYYKNGKKETNITYAIQGQRFDPYFKIIERYFEDGRTIESIAEEMGVDVSTVVRNKKRLCLQIYKDIM